LALRWWNCRTSGWGELAAIRSKVASESSTGYFDLAILVVGSLWAKTCCESIFDSSCVTMYISDKNFIFMSWLSTSMFKIRLWLLIVILRFPIHKIKVHIWEIQDNANYEP
jgi:hypothetical protein